MPRFSEREKAVILEKLCSEGERLFIAHGIKKVTVDDLAKAAGIAKGSFYAFYSSKEHLYMDVLGRLQNKIWIETDAFLEANSALKARELTKQTILWALKQMEKYALLVQLDNETIDYLRRKLPREALDAHTEEDGLALKKLKKYGVSFSCKVDVAAKALQLATMAIINSLDKDDADYDAILDIMLSGLVNEIVSDEE